MMNSKLSTMLCTNKRIEVLYEVDTAAGGFAAVVRRSDGTEELYPNCKVETLLDTLAACRGKSLSRMRLLRGMRTGRVRGHIDFYELSLSLILMPLRFRQAVNTGHGVMAYLNIARIVDMKQNGAGSEVRFLSGRTFYVRESAGSVQGKIIARRELLYDRYFAHMEELHGMRINLRQLQKRMEGSCL